MLLLLLTPLTPPAPTGRVRIWLPPPTQGLETAAHQPDLANKLEALDGEERECLAATILAAARASDGWLWWRQGRGDGGRIFGSGG